MAVSRKRKSAASEQRTEQSAKRQSKHPSQSPEPQTETPTAEDVQDGTPSNTTETANPDATQRAQDLQTRFKALKARNTQSRNQNRKETAAESQRLSTDPNMINSLQRKQDIANQKLMKADAEAAGEDFERKRAWDWTIDEAEKWDKRMEKKEKARGSVAFQDYRADAKKVYKRQLKQMGNPDFEAYEKEKHQAIEQAAQNGSLEVVETEDGELVAVDKDGAFYSTANSTDFASHKPSKESLDKLVEEIRKADEVRWRKRRERGKGEDEADVTYINDKNKVCTLAMSLLYIQLTRSQQFNLKLKRFYDKYTVGVRESFERGTAL